MANEATEELVAESKTTDNPKQEESSEDRANLEFIYNSSVAGGLQDTDEFKQLFPDGKLPEYNAVAPVTTPAAATPAAETVATPAATPEVEVEDDEEDIFGIGTPAKKAEGAPEIKTLEDFNAEVTRRFSITDPDTFLDSYAKQRKTAQNNAKAASDLEKINNGIQSLPISLKHGIDAFSKGLPMDQVVLAVTDNQHSLDMSVPIANYTKEQLVRGYFNGQYSALEAKLKDEESDFSQADFDTEVTTLYGLSSTQFTSQKSAHDAELNRLQTASDELKTKFDGSVTVSVQALQTDYPGFRADELKTIQSQLENGDFNGLFKNEDGTLKPEAGKMVAMALYGEKQLKRGAKSAKAVGRSEANAEIVDKSRKTPEGDSKSSGAGGPSEEQQKVAEMTQGLVTTDPYASKP